MNIPTSILNKMHKKIELNRKISALFLFILPLVIRLYLSKVPWCIVSAQELQVKMQVFESIFLEFNLNFACCLLPDEPKIRANFAKILQWCNACTKKFYFQEAVMAYIKERGNNNYFVRVSYGMLENGRPFQKSRLFHPSKFNLSASKIREIKLRRVEQTRF